MKRVLYYMVLLACATTSWSARAAAVNYRYWFDQDSTVAGTGRSTANAWQVDIDVSGLSEAIHALHLQAIDANGVASPAVTRFFVRSRLADTPRRVAYWVDDSIAPMMTSDVANGMVMLDVSALPDGLHYLHVQALGGLSSEVRTYFFVKQPDMAQVKQVHVTTWIDNAQNCHYQGILPVTNGIVSWLENVVELPEGRHSITVHLMGDMGYQTLTGPYFFANSLTGDVNNDGVVDVDDLNIVINIMVRKDTNESHDGRADINEDGVVDVDDLNIIINVIVRKE
ncbi:MAG: dockerin type I repeat-containing protein [Muribaculaceae bacterium]|nr:dockerin type I repeat-containing protein [Muribaculaceae bacterium]